jgi:hypothetical protein
VQPASAPTVPTASGGGSGTLLDCEGNAQVAPKAYQLGCFDALNNLENMRWARWGRTAAGTGTQELNNCVPSCSAHKSTFYAVTVQAEDPAASGKHAYLEMTITYPGTAPALSGGEAGGKITAKTSHSYTVRLDNSSAN